MARTNTAQKIIAHATDLFREKGYHATSMNDIANGIGLKKASLYNHFSSKEMIARKVVDAVCLEFENTIFNIGYKEEIAASDRLREVLDSLYRYFQDKNACILASLSMGELGDKSLPSEEVRQFKQQWIDVFTHILQARYSLDVATKMAVDIVLRIQGSLILNRLNDDASDDVLRRCCDEIAATLD